MSHIALVPRPIVQIVPPVQLTRVLFCATCGTWTPHALNKSETHYVCGCGEQIEYHINKAPAMWAIR